MEDNVYIKMFRVHNNIDAYKFLYTKYSKLAVNYMVKIYRSKKLYLPIETEDFSTISFLVFDSIIRKFDYVNNANEKFISYFLRSARNMIFELVRKYLTDGEKILSFVLPIDNYKLESIEKSEVENEENHKMEEITKLVSEMSLFSRQIFQYKLKGMSNIEISKVTMMPVRKISNFWFSLKNKILKLYNSKQNK